MNNFQVILLCCMFLGSFSVIFADPSIPPPPPPVTSYTYTLMDEFKDCGSDDQVANYCDEYYSRQKVVASGGSITESSLVFVCGMDSRCTPGSACTITGPNDNTSWKSLSLTQNWVCPDGYGIASMHQPGDLDPHFDTLSLDSSAFATRNFPYLTDNDSIDVYFNAYIPACVNRIPMMNFNITFKNSQGETIRDKVGLYARHETLDYDLNPFGGYLENFELTTELSSFKESFILDTSLASYRMWSFRERFVDGLQRTVVQKNLEAPVENIDGLDSNRAHDFENLYLSRDFMLGSYSVDNTNNAPQGDDLTQEFNLECNFDVSSLGIAGIETSFDLEDALDNSDDYLAVLSSLRSNSEICSIDSDFSLDSISFNEHLQSFDIDSVSKTVVFDIEDIDKRKYDSVEEFESWAPQKLSTLSSKLRYLDILESDPVKEEISEITSFSYEEKSKVIELKARDYNFDNSSEFIDYLNNITTSAQLADFSDDLKSQRDLGSHELLISLDRYSEISPSRVEVEVSYYTQEITLEVVVEGSQVYFGFAAIDMTLLYETSTESSWNWRSLESLTLDQLAACLYNWDECLFQSRVEPGISWSMNEVADLGYGPMYDSVAYVWSKNQLESDYADLTYGYHFDGARGFDELDETITLYKECKSDEHWMSEDGIYVCSKGLVFKCGYGLSLDEDELGFVSSASVGDTVLFTTTQGYVCTGSVETQYSFKEISCLP